MTTYIEKDLLRQIRLLQKERWIDSITALVNDALREHVNIHYERLTSAQ